MDKEQLCSLLLLSEKIAFCDEDIELGQVDVVSEGGMFVEAQCDEWLTHATLPFTLSNKHFYEN